MARSIYVPGLGHRDLPIPAAARRGPFLATGGIRGVDPSTGQMPEHLDDQVRLAFENLKSIVEAGGGTVDDIVHVTVHAATDEVRQIVNENWVALFPEAEARPARHLLRHDLPGGMLVQLEAMAFIEGAAGGPDT